MASIIGQGALGVEGFLRAYPGMGLRPIRDNRVELEGVFAFSAESDKHGKVTDKFELKIDIPNTFPKELPLVYELNGRIPREDRYHVNPTDYSLCLGSPLRLLIILARVPTLTGFATKCLIPYLYAVSLKLDRGGEFAFGQLPHGRRGEMVDYGDLLGLGTVNQGMKTISYLGMKKRRANKLPCPCECGQRLGVCTLNRRVSELRQVAPRAWFRKLLSDLSRIEPASSLFHSAVRIGLGVRNAAGDSLNKRYLW